MYMYTIPWISFMHVVLQAESVNSGSQMDFAVSIKDAGRLFTCKTKVTFLPWYIMMLLRI